MEVLQEWVKLVKEQFQQISLLESMGVCFGIAQVLFAKNNKVWLYPCGLISIFITTILFFEARLYAEIILQGYYFSMSIYGWILWSKRGGMALYVDYSNLHEWKLSISIVVITWGVLYLFLRHFTNSDVPVWDSFVSAFAWAGMWLLAKRKIENWIFLNISNFAAIPLYIHKGLLLYSLLTIFLFIIAIFGYSDWKKSIASKKQIDGNQLSL